MAESPETRCPDCGAVVLVTTVECGRCGRHLAVDAIEALDLAIFSLNTFLDPSASSDDDMAALDEKAEAAITRLVSIREWCIAQGDDLPSDITGDEPEQYSPEVAARLARAMQGD